MSECNNISKRIDFKKIASMKLYCSDELSDIHFLFRCDDDDDEDMEIYNFGKDEILPSENVDDDAAVDAAMEEIEPIMKRVPAHKIILAAGSVVFHQMFFGTLKEDKTVEIVDVSVDAFIEFLQFFYLTQPKLTYVNAREVIYCGIKYDVPHVVDAYKQFLEEDALVEGNECSILKVAIRYEFPQLIAKCERMIETDSARIFTNSDFIRCDRMVLQHILSMENLNCTELDVYSACMNWALERRKLAIETKKFTSKSLKCWLGECWRLIRFPTMSISEFTTCLTTSRNYFENDEISNILGYIVHGNLLENSIFNITRRGNKTHDDSLHDDSDDFED